MRKCKVLFTITMVMGTFSEIVECETLDHSSLKKALQKKVNESGIQADGKIPKIQEIILIEPLPITINSSEDDSL